LTEFGGGVTRRLLAILSQDLLQGPTGPGGAHVAVGRSSGVGGLLLSRQANSAEPSCDPVAAVRAPCGPPCWPRGGERANDFPCRVSPEQGGSHLLRRTRRQPPTSPTRIRPPRRRTRRGAHPAAVTQGGKREGLAHRVRSVGLRHAADLTRCSVTCCSSDNASDDRIPGRLRGGARAAILRHLPCLTGLAAAAACIGVA